MNLGRVRERLPLLACIVMLAALAGLTAILAQRAANQRATGPIKVNLSKPDWFVEGFVLVRSAADDLASWQITATRMEHIPTADRIALTNPVLTRVDPRQPTTVVRAQRGEILELGDAAHLFGNVQLTRAAGAGRAQLRILADQIDLLPNRDLASSPGAVRVEHGKSVLTGVGMEFDNQSRRLQVLAKVQGEWPSPATVTR
jgi:lipopolysaccharide export system protein LptC